jgi:hypothetical protein
MERVCGTRSASLPETPVSTLLPVLQIQRTIYNKQIGTYTKVHNAHTSGVCRTPRAKLERA